MRKRRSEERETIFEEKEQTENNFDGKHFAVLASFNFLALSIETQLIKRVRKII